MSDVDEKMFLQAETSFGLNFLNTLPANESLVFSPLSIALCLSLVHAGAKGKSKEQIGDALLSGASDSQFVDHFQFISESLKKGEYGVKVDVANKVFVSKDFTINPTFLTTIKTHYSAGAENLDFTSPKSAATINDWIKKQTGGKIGDLVTPDALQDALALLVNAVYFEGKWGEDFDGYSTSPGDFFKSNGEKVKVPLMKDMGTDRVLGQDDEFKVLVMGYKDDKFKMAVFLPKVKNGLEKAMKTLDAAKFQKLLSGAKRTYMNTIIPKFTIEKEVDLKDHLEKLGISEVFSSSADLSGMAPNVKISDGKHKAIIEVNEEGTIASAATYAKAYPMMLRMDEPVDFVADHPFLFALLHENHPLFLGVFHG